MDSCFHYYYYFIFMIYRIARMSIYGNKSQKAILSITENQTTMVPLCSFL